MSRNVLVVDNNPAISKFIANLLEKEGHQVSTAGDGLSALRIIEGCTPDIIFVDLVMPNIGGDKLCQIVRANPKLRDVRLVIISAVAAEEAVTPAKYGADACIAKGPFAKMAKHILGVFNQLDSGPELGSPDAVLGIEDIYEREITKELLFSKRHFEKILDNMSEGILELSPDAKIVFANRVAVSIFGIPEERLLASCFADYFDGDQRTRVGDILDSIGQGPQRTGADSLVKYREKDLSMRFFPVNDEEGDPVIVILNDVTEHRRGEREKLRVERELEEQRALSMASDRLRSLGEMAAGIAHELNQPLVGVRGLAEHVLIGIDRGWKFTDENIRQKVQLIVEQSERMTHIIDHVCVFAKEAGRPEVRQVRINDVILSSTGLVNAQLRTRGVKLKFGLAEDLPFVLVNPLSLEEIVINLISNSRDAIEEKMSKDPESTMAEIMLRTREVEESPDGTGRRVLIEVVDCGIGISEENLPKVFDPFFTTKGPDRGTGLGLAVSKSIIEEFGGTLEIQSELNRGTTAIISLKAEPLDGKTPEGKHE